jgi:hypothetical protein
MNKGIESSWVYDSGTNVNRSKILPGDNAFQTTSPEPLRAYAEFNAFLVHFLQKNYHPSYQDKEINDEYRR